MKKEEVKRLKITEKTLKRLFGTSNNLCAFQGCKMPVIDSYGDVRVQICHIESAEKGGQRFNPNMSNEDRRSFDNLILLCSNHHDETNNVINFPTVVMRGIKQKSMDTFINSGEELGSNLVLKKFLEDKDKVEKILLEKNKVVDLTVNSSKINFPENLDKIAEVLNWNKNNGWEKERSLLLKDFAIFATEIGKIPIVNRNYLSLLLKQIVDNGKVNNLRIELSISFIDNEMYSENSMKLLEYLINKKIICYDNDQEPENIVLVENEKYIFLKDLIKFWKKNDCIDNIEKNIVKGDYSSLDE